MEIRIKVSDGLHAMIKDMADFHEIPITSQVKLYITNGLQKDGIRKNAIEGDVDVDKPA